MPRRYDAHSHIFNVFYLLDEYAFMAFMAFFGNYPGTGQTQARELHADSVFGDIGQVLKWIVKVIETGVALMGAEGVNLQTTLSAADSAWGGANQSATIVLMMDIYFTYAQPLLADEPWHQFSMKSLSNQLAVLQPSDIQLGLRHVQTRLQDVGLNPDLVAKTTARLNGFIQARRLIHADEAGFFKTPGFWAHMEALRLLKLDPILGPRFYPFLAVDPRRTGIIDEVLKGELVGKNLPFRGIKLYPMLGYHPQCAALESLFDWCAANAIPITVHCEEPGFPPPYLFAQNYSGLGAPKNYIPILEKYKKLGRDLRINFAHFGYQNPVNGVPVTDWTNDIVQLMQDYDGVFADFACTNQKADILTIKNSVWANQKAKERTLFGTDFDVEYLSSGNQDLANYYANFDEANNPGAFTAVELAQISGDNVERFLG
jgi:hypothetical protein